MYLKSIIICFLAYFFALIFSFGLLEYVSSSHIWLDIVIAHFTATFIIFFFSLMYKNSSLYDPFWSVMPFFIFLYLVFNAEVEESTLGFGSIPERALLNNKYALDPLVHTLAH